MTLLVFIKDNRNDLWAALSDCLITSDASKEGISLRTPNRSQNQRRTYGFTEVRLEEKLGLIGKNELFGWENSRHEARKTLGALLADPEKVSPDLFISQPELENSYLHIQFDPISKKSSISLSLAARRFKKLEKGHLTIFACGSGKDLVDSLRFTTFGPFDLGSATDCLQAALMIVGRVISEELGGEESQFYSRRTGCWYKVFYPGPNGIEQYRLGHNHWHLGMNGEPLVSPIIVPWEQNAIDFVLDFQVQTDWNLEFVNAVAILPISQMSYPKRKLDINPAEAIFSSKFDGTIHFCWRETSHRAFGVHAPEPRFERFGDFFQRPPILQRHGKLY